MKIQKKIKNILIFLKEALKNPRSVGAFAPASKYLARSVVLNLPRDTVDFVVELGPGTGAITKELKLLKPKLIELDGEFCAILKNDFPELEVINTCAVEYVRSLTNSVGVVCSIPLINNPIANQLREVIFKKKKEGVVKWVVIYTYGKNNPIDSEEFKTKISAKKVWLNIPPATVWINI